MKKYLICTSARNQKFIPNLSGFDAIALRKGIAALAWKQLIIYCQIIFWNKTFSTVSDQRLFVMPLYSTPFLITKPVYQLDYEFLAVVCLHSIHSISFNQCHLHRAHRFVKATFQIVPKLQYFVESPK